MSFRIASNTTAFQASLNLDNNSNAENNDIEQLSSGLQINSAMDNPAGLVISENMKAQLSGITQATQNTNDADNEVKTAEGALNQVQSLLVSMRTLAVDASNAGVNDQQDVLADQTQIQSAIQSINQIAAQTTFGAKNLLDGSANSGATTTAGTATVGNPGSTDLAIVQQASSYGTTAETYNTITANAATSTTASSAVGGTYTAASDTYGGSLTIDGNSYAIGNGTSTTNTFAAVQTAATAAGYTASVDSTGDITLTANTAGAPSTTQTASLSGLSRYTSAGVSQAAYGATSVTQGNSAGLTLESASGATLSSSNFTTTGATSTYYFSNGLQVTSSDAPPATGSTSITGSISTPADATTTGSALQFQIGADAGETASINIQSTSSAQLGQDAASYVDANGVTQSVQTSNVQDINVTTFKGSQDAIQVLDKAINDVSNIRASLGSFDDNVLQSQEASLEVANTNLQSSESDIVDTDLASTVVNYTKDSILVQAATSALGYATQAPEEALKLLQ